MDALKRKDVPNLNKTYGLFCLWFLLSPARFCRGVRFSSINEVKNVLSLLVSYLWGRYLVYPRNFDGFFS